MHRYKTIEKRYRGENCCWTIQNETHLIPRIRLQKSDCILQFTFQRFPLRQCFGLIIKKAQGRTLQVVGLDLRTPVFSHGMLYVALSRTGKKKCHTHSDRGRSNVKFRLPRGIGFWKAKSYVIKRAHDQRITYTTFKTRTPDRSWKG